MRLVTLPNLLTLARLLLTIPVVLLILNDQYAAALLFTIIAVLSDLDGILARRTDTTTRFGAIFDPVTDLIFTMGALAALAVHGAIAPVTIILLVAASCVKGAVMLLLLERTGQLPASTWSKSSAVLAFLLIPWALVGLPLIGWFSLLAVLNAWLVALKRVVDAAHTFL